MTPAANRTTLITGAGSGIGRALAIEASRRGFRVALTGRRRETLAQTQRALDRPEDSVIIVANVMTPEGRERLRTELAASWGRLTCLVNNAGIVAGGPLYAMRDTDLELLIATNLTAPIALTRELLPLLRAASPARVINIGSLAGDIALPLFSAYSATKFGLRGLSDAMRIELANLGVGVTYAAPSGVRTAAAEGVAPFLSPLGMRATGSPTAVAARIWDAAERGANNIYGASRDRWLVAIARLMPWMIAHALARRLELRERPDRPPTAVSAVYRNRFK